MIHYYYYYYYYYYNTKEKINKQIIVTDTIIIIIVIIRCHGQIVPWQPRCRTDVRRTVRTVLWLLVNQPRTYIQWKRWHRITWHIEVVVNNRRSLAINCLPCFSVELLVSHCRSTWYGDTPTTTTPLWEDQQRRTTSTCPLNELQLLPCGPLLDRSQRRICIEPLLLLLQLLTEHRRRKLDIRE